MARIATNSRPSTIARGTPQWSPDGRSVYFTVQERGNVRLYRQPLAGGKPELVINDRGSVGAYSVAKSGAIAYTFSSPRDTAELYLRSGANSKQLTKLNR